MKEKGNKEMKTRRKLWESNPVWITRQERKKEQASYKDVPQPLMTRLRIPSRVSFLLSRPPSRTAAPIGSSLPPSLRAREIASGCSILRFKNQQHEQLNRWKTGKGNARKRKKGKTATRQSSKLTFLSMSNGDKGQDWEQFVQEWQFWGET